MAHRREQWFTWANVVTCVRAVAGLAVFCVATSKESATWNYAGLAIYWSLDVADGYLARKLDQETRFGAQFDILADRLLIACFYFNYLRWHPELVAPVALFLFNFMVIDHFLSNQFMRWSIRSPNYFFRVDRDIWLLNWSIPGKVLNGGVFTVILIVTESILYSGLFCIALIAVKLWSVARLAQLADPEADWGG